MTTSLKTLKSYHSLGFEGEARTSGGGATLVDLHADREGNCFGTLEKLGTVTEFLVVGGERSWLKHDEANLASTRQFLIEIGRDEEEIDAAIAKVRGKYVELSASDREQYPDMALCDLDKAFAGLPDHVSTVKHGKPGQKDGRTLIPLIQQPDLNGVTVHVPMEGVPVPWAIEFEIDDNPVLVSTKDHGKPVEVKAPSPSQTTDDALDALFG